MDARKVFVTLWTTVTLLKLVVVARLPLFVDEAFYWQEGQHMAWAYSDLPGLTAWLIRLGGELFGDSVLAARLPFLMIAAALPWMAVRIGVREFDERSGWVSGCAALLLPLFGTLGLLALPDVLMALATLLCVDACTRLLRSVSYDAALVLAVGLAIGALSHYRFIAVIGAGLVALLLSPKGRELLRDPRVVVAIAFGAAAWMPLLAWNIENAEAGLRFQLVDRHPWAFHVDGISFLAIQGLLVTPLLFVALLAAAWRFRADGDPARRLLAISGAVVVAGFFALGFFADTERVSFHWPFPGYVALLPLLPAAIAGWTRWLRAAMWGLAGIGLLAVLGYYVVVSVPSVREDSVALKWYPSNFAGWDELEDAVRDQRAKMPDGTRLVADNFKIGAELGFALGDPDIPVLDHPLNRAHGRAPQLQLWGLHIDTRAALGDGPLLLVASATDVKFSELLDRYQTLCRYAGALPPPRVVNVDHGGQRFLLFALPGGASASADPDECVTPALAHINGPGPGARVPPVFEVRGWAIKDVAGVAGVTITLDGRPVAEADYGARDAWPQQFYRGRSRDPNHPAIAFSATVDASRLVPGRHWLGLEIRGNDGSRETWAERPVVVERD